MIRTFTEEVHCSVTEIADEVWAETAKDQVTVLSCLNTRFFKDECSGNMQMAAMSLELDKCDDVHKTNVKHFVSKLYEYLVQE